jgi:predicted transcriptional regulator
MCYTASMRPGKTRTTSFSLDDATLKNLKALAERRHKGNVSALLAEIASREAKFIAAEALFDTHGVPPLDDEAIERIEAEWRGAAPSKKKRRRAA